MLMTRVPEVGAWAVEGDSRAALERAGWEFRADIATVPANTQATISVYPLLLALSLEHTFV